jgi:hypothetical protein
MFFPVSCPLALTCQASSHHQIIKSSEEDAHQQQVNFDKLLRRLKESNIEINTFANRNVKRLAFVKGAFGGN